MYQGRAELDQVTEYNILDDSSNLIQQCRSAMEAAQAVGRLK